MSERYLEEFEPGVRFTTATFLMTEARIKAFAAEFDPQPFHLDEELAKESVFGGLTASGWHTAAVTMKLLAESDTRPGGGFIGVGAEEFRFPRPVRPGDELHVEWEVLEARPSQSRPGQGLLRVRTSTMNQAGEPVLTYVMTLWVRCRPANSG